MARIYSSDRIRREVPGAEHGRSSTVEGEKVMTIVIQSIPNNQVLNEVSGDTSYLSVYVTGLDDPTEFPVTALLDGTNAPNFVNPPDVLSVTPSGDEFVVILQLTGTMVCTGGGTIIVRLGGPQDGPLDAELTVTICQEALCSQPMAVIAIYLACPN
jgi:hypothetical protein